MKKTLVLLGMSLVFFACGDSGQKEESTTDTATHANTESGTATTDTSNMAGMKGMEGMQGDNLMSVMQSHMKMMKEMKSASNPDNDFASMMKMHHQGAIDMAKVEISKGTDSEMKQMAQKSIDDQQKDISEFDNFLANHKADSGGDDFFKEVMGMMNMSIDMNMSGSTDEQFAKMMIPHHKTGIQMAQAYLKKGHEEKMKSMANKIIAAQQKEIKDLQAWLDKHGK